MFGGDRVIGLIVRFVVSAVVLFLVGFIAPGFRVADLTGVLIIAMVIAIIGYVIETAFGNKSRQISRGLIGFFIAAVVIYTAQFIIPGLVYASITGALLSSIGIGIVDSFVALTPLETGIQRPKLTAQGLAIDMELATELVQHKNKFHQKEQAFSEPVVEEEPVVQKEPVIQEKLILQEERQLIKVQALWHHPLNQLIRDMNQFKNESQQHNYYQLQHCIQKGMEALDQANQYIQSAYVLTQMNNSIEQAQQQLKHMIQNAQN